MKEAFLCYAMIIDKELTEKQLAENFDESFFIQKLLIKNGKHFGRAFECE